MKVISTDKPFTVFSIEADRDYILARLINFTGNNFSSRAGYLAQQACEKYFKALLVQKEKSYLKTHDLIELSRYSSKFKEIFSNEDFLKKLKIFDNFREVGRYGAEAFYDPQSKKQAQFETAGVFFWDDRYIKYLDEVVFLIRSELNFKSIGWGDPLLAIIQNDSNDLFVDTWKFPVPIKNILASHNDFFKE